MKKILLLLACGAALWSARTASAVNFELSRREPGPGHKTLTYWWKFNGSYWELMAPEHFTLEGGGELRLQRTDHPDTTAICRQSSSTERELFAKKDPAAQDVYFRTLLPSGVKDLKLVSQRDNPLPVNGLSNIEAVYAYELGGIRYRTTLMTNRAVQEPDKKADPSAKPKEDYFTAVITASQEFQPTLYEAFQQLLATARVSKQEPSSDQNGQIVSHGMLGR